jgi:hypothetical protein
MNRFVSTDLTDIQAALDIPLEQVREELERGRAEGVDLTSALLDFTVEQVTMHVL